MQSAKRGHGGTAQCTCAHCSREQLKDPPSPYVPGQLGLAPPPISCKTHCTWAHIYIDVGNRSSASQGGRVAGNPPVPARVVTGLQPFTGWKNLPHGTVWQAKKLVFFSFLLFQVGRTAPTQRRSMIHDARAQKITLIATNKGIYVNVTWSMTEKYMYVNITKGKDKWISWHKRSAYYPNSSSTTCLEPRRRQSKELPQVSHISFQKLMFSWQASKR